MGPGMTQLRSDRIRFKHGSKSTLSTQGAIEQQIIDKVKTERPSQSRRIGVLSFAHPKRLYSEYVFEPLLDHTKSRDPTKARVQHRLGAFKGLWYHGPGRAR